LVAGKKRVPRPAAGITALRIVIVFLLVAAVAAAVHVAAVAAAVQQR
jgi:hypothetical protein